MTKGDVCMKIDFSDYKSLTQKDIIKIDNAGIECTIGKILFAECQINFKECRNIDGNYIGEFDCSGSHFSIGLYTAPKTTHIFFMDDESLFNQVIETIKEYGYEFIDIEKIQ